MITLLGSQRARVKAPEAAVAIWRACVVHLVGQAWGHRSAPAAAPPQPRIGPGAIELGYWVHVDFTGRGYATACARALTQAGLALSDVARVEIQSRSPCRYDLLPFTLLWWPLFTTGLPLLGTGL